MTVTDHKWLDPNCNENGCQSLVLRESYQELITALAMHSKQMTYAGNAKKFVDAVINNLDEVDAILPDSLNRTLVERIKGLLERANREAKLAVEFNEARERAEGALRELVHVAGKVALQMGEEWRLEHAEFMDAYEAALKSSQGTKDSGTA